MGDVDFDVRTGCVLALIVPGPGCICGFQGHEKEYVIPFGSVCQIGEDIILVDVKRKDVEAACRIRGGRAGTERQEVCLDRGKMLADLGTLR